MNLTHRVACQFGKSLALAALGICLLTPASHAAQIELNVMVGNKYVLVVPGSNTGGRVVYSKQHFSWITDRVLRGEKVDAWFWPSNPTEAQNPYVFRAWLTSTAGTGPTLRLPGGQTMLTFATFTVPTSPLCDNNYIWVETMSLKNSSLRIPVGSGSRPQ
jgi:hypothetical protein